MRPPEPGCSTATRGASADTASAAAAEEQLRDGLRLFIARELERALGEEFAPLYAPSPTANAQALCSFVSQRWLGVFADSPLADRRHLVDAARAALRTPSQPRGIVRSAEALLAAIGARSRSAQVAHIAKQAPPDDAMDAEPAPPTAAPARVPPPIREDASMDVDAGAGAALPRVPVVLDGANIGWRYGRTRFSMAGAAAALAYFRRRGHAAALVLPEGRMQAAHDDHDDDRDAHAWICTLQGTDALVLTPHSDYDDAYIVHVARRAGAVVVSNDRFADVAYQADAGCKQAAQTCKEYLMKCRVSFAFHGAAFVPNPAFDFAGALALARRLALPPD